MPSGVIHKCIAKNLNNYFKINDKYFDLGNISPDSWRNSESTKTGSHFYVPGMKEKNYMVFFKKYKDQINNPYVLGYLTHLITDNYWYSNNLENYKDTKEETLLYSKLSKIYELEKTIYIDDKFKNPIEELSINGINDTVKYINELQEYRYGELEKIDINEVYEKINITTKYVKNKILELKIKQ